MQQQSVPVFRVTHRLERNPGSSVRGKYLSISTHAISNVGLWVLLCIFWGMILAVALTNAL